VNNLATIEGMVERIVYRNPDNDFTVARLSVEGKRGLTTIVGLLAGVREGENLRVQGRWVIDRRYGQQLKIESYLTISPSTVKGIERFLASGLIKGISTTLAGRIVSKFGINTLEILDENPDKLQLVEGIGKKKLKGIKTSWHQQKKMREILIYLQSHGISSTYAVKIYRRYQKNTIRVIREDPYRLALEIKGIGFKKADQIALQTGITLDSPQRARASLLFILSKASKEGHVFVLQENLIDICELQMEIPSQRLQDALEDLIKLKMVVREDERIYLHGLYAAEEEIVNNLQRLTKSKTRNIKFSPETEIQFNRFEAEKEIKLSPSQKEAILKALYCKILVITGGPGTGKTTIIRAIVDLLGNKQVKMLLASPTGRAAKRLAEVTFRKATTIHRLLEYSPHDNLFLRNRDNQLSTDIVIVDEASMLDVFLFNSLLEALPSHCHLVLIGDVDQLPSVGPGNILNDVINSHRFNLVRLQDIFRQSEMSSIIVNAHRINQGKMPQFPKPTHQDELLDSYFIVRPEPEAALAVIKELVANRIPKKFNLDPISQIQVIAPMHNGITGIDNLNQELQNILNPGKMAIKYGNKEFRPGDKVMQIKNNYDKNVFNGDIGIIVALDREKEKITIRFDNRDISYEPQELEEVEIAYAITVHKSQGSEYQAIIMPVLTQHYIMLQRNLLYTAFTRGKKLVVLVGTYEALGMAVRNNKIKTRMTALKNKLQVRLKPSGP